MKTEDDICTFREGCKSPAYAVISWFKGRDKLYARACKEHWIEVKDNVNTIIIVGR
jgi:hypothetical protein